MNDGRTDFGGVLGCDTVQNGVVGIVDLGDDLQGVQKTVGHGGNVVLQVAAEVETQCELHEASGVLDGGRGRDGRAGETQEGARKNGSDKERSEEEGLHLRSLGFLIMFL